tara:strand:+ start:567 stop:947 length:381 start_codon:yes stop_codon:yes gene_type:complete
MKTISFRNALYAQVIWFIAATIFNVLSIVAMADGQTGWAGPTPVSSQIIATVMAAVIVFGFLAWRRTYPVAASLVLVALALGGVGRHLYADASAYASTTTWAMAIGINVFGCLAFLAGVFFVKRTG